MAITELKHSRIQRNDPNYRRFQRIFKGLLADLSEGAGGWVGSGLPEQGDAYPYGTWASKITPVCVSVDIDPRDNGEKIRIIAVYVGRREL